MHKHASTTRAAISLRRIANYFHLVIADDGRGWTNGRVYHPGQDRLLPMGVGIAGMTARMRQF